MFGACASVLDDKRLFVAGGKTEIDAINLALSDTMNRATLDAFRAYYGPNIGHGDEITFSKSAYMFNVDDYKW
jgi:hypothetical protein